MANFCGKCGSKIQLGSAFCSNCGAPISEEFISQPETMVTFPDKRKKSRKWVIVLGSVIAVILVAIAVLFLYPFKKTKWYMSEEILSYYSSSEQQWEMYYTKKYLPDNQLLEFEIVTEYADGKSSSSTSKNVYDGNNWLIAEETDGSRTNEFIYTKKDNNYVGESTYTDIFGDSCYKKVIYNEDNQLVFVGTYNNDMLESSSEYTYHDNGGQKELKEIGSIWGDCIYQYDERGKILLYERTNDSGIYKEIYEYEKNILIEVKCYEDDVLTLHEVLESRADNVCNTVQYDNDDSIIGYIKYVYDDYDNLIEKTYYNSEKQPVSRCEYVWVERGSANKISNTVSNKDDEEANNTSSVANDLEIHVDTSNIDDENNSNGLYNLIEENTLIVAVDASFEPFLYMKDGEIVGFEAELIECIASEMGLTVKYRNVLFENIINDIENNKADIGISLIFPTSSRREKVDFSETYFSDIATGDEYAIAVGKDTNLLETINETIIRLINNGKIDELKQKYNISTIDWTS